ncbi:MAG: tRNA (N6-isopentenyl adenosine(37)-C2)-methylthiotransferase MiaB [Patescibacteria group bacterium]
MKYFIYTFGCQMNKSDSERIAGFLENQNFVMVKNFKEADWVILNTCSVRQSAEDRVFGLIKNLKKLKNRPKIAITGCMATKNTKELKKKADLVFEIENLHQLNNYLKKFHISGDSLKCEKKNFTDSYFKISPHCENNFHAYVPIATGCNNFCTYCVVPYVRGREVSRPLDEILCEIKNLLKQGYKAITLIGQNVNSYGHDFKKQPDFPKLLQKIEKIQSNFWLWFITSHPKDMSDQLIKTIAKSKKICRYIHLPTQAGDNKVLAAMNRGYTREKYLKLIAKIKKALSDASLSTDIIVGFPGETKAQFQKTVDLFKKVKFDMAYIAEYSPRPGTAAYNLKDNVPSQEKKRRHKVLDKLLRQIALEKNKKLIGKTLEALIEAKKGNFYFGKTKTFKTIKITNNQQLITNNQLIGQIIPVKIKKAYDFGLEGKSTS